MSNDKRLGVNPLSWVAPEASGHSIPPQPTTTAPQAAPLETQNNPQDRNNNYNGLFSAPSMITKEDFMGKDKIKIKQVMETTDVAAHLEDLATSLGAGVIRAEDGKSSIVLCTDETMHFEMKLSLKKGKAKCSIEMEWEDDGSKAEAFKISSD